MMLGLETAVRNSTVCRNRRAKILYLILNRKLEAVCSSEVGSQQTCHWVYLR